MRREHALVDEIEAELEAIAGGLRDDRVGAGDLLAVERFLE